VTDEELVYRASGARTRAYAPYSGFEVGVALLADGDVFDGANVENASYGLSLCAERNAVVKAVLEGSREIQVVAIYTETSPPAPPCGMCLQTLREFCKDPATMRVLLSNTKGETSRHTLAELLPLGFKPEDLPPRLVQVEE
jgi:cytidine deaminase